MTEPDGRASRSGHELRNSLVRHAPDDGEACRPESLLHSREAPLMTMAIALAGSNGPIGRPVESPRGRTSRGGRRSRRRSSRSTPRGRRRGLRAGGQEGGHRLPVQPQGSDDREVGEVGTQAGQGVQECATAGVHRLRPVQADRRDVLRRHRHQATVRCWRSSRSCSTAACRPSRARVRRSRRRRWWCCTGASISTFPGGDHLGQRQVHPVPVRRHPDPGRLQRVDGGDARIARRVRIPPPAATAIRRVHRTIVGDNLASIAYAEYGDPAHWRPLAAFNGIDDPLRLPSGRTILLPSLEEMGVTG